MSDVSDWLAGLQVNGAEEESVDVAAAYARFQVETKARSAARRNWSLSFSRPQWSAVGVVLGLLLLLTLTPVRTLGQRFLESMRIQKLAVVRVGNGEITRSGMSGSQQRALSQLISDDVVMTIKPGPPVVVADATTAASQTGMQVEALSGLGVPRLIQVEDQAAFHVTLDADKIRAVLEEVGRADIAVPDSVNGSIVAVHVSKGVQMKYGNCGEHGSSGDDTCVQVMQVPIPEINVPPDLNMPALAAAWLQLTGLSAAEADHVAQTIDWSSTLVIPLPEDQSTYQTVPVDGVAGVLIQQPAKLGRSGAFDLIWVKQGVLHSIMGPGNSARALAAVSGLG